MPGCPEGVPGVAGSVGRPQEEEEEEEEGGGQGEERKRVRGEGKESRWCASRWT